MTKSQHSEEHLTKGILQLPNKITPFLLIAYYLLERFPGNRTILIFNPNNLMNSLIDLPLVARGYLNTRLSQNIF